MKTDQGLTTGDDSCNKWLNLRRPIPEEDQPWTENNISMVTRWMSTDVPEINLFGKRNYARSHSSDLFKPKRLLDLFPTGKPEKADSTVGDIVLFETPAIKRATVMETSHPNDLEYAALSYCWGDADSLIKTTKRNFESGHRHIEFTGLPPCLRDAVIVARSLDIRYLWIDALCIIQDDTDDWAAEAAKMGDIFSNAVLTIGAASSRSFDEGFLSRPSFTALTLPFRSSLNSRISGKITLSTVPMLLGNRPRNLMTTDSSLALDLWNSKWDTRGWVWQEHMLSERLLVFGKHMIHLKSRRQTQSENNTVSYDEEPPQDTSPNMWQLYLNIYSGKSFTYLQDKLPAISGIAKPIDQRWHGKAQYLAGIWVYSPDLGRNPDEDWLGQLCWRLVEQPDSFQEMLTLFKRTALEGPEAYSAPTWSWASRRPGATWESGVYDGSSTPWKVFEAHIEDHQIIPMGPDHMGRVKPGSYLKLSGLMRQTSLNLHAAKKRDRWWEMSSSTHEFLFSVDWQLSPLENEDKFEHAIQLFGLWGGRPNWESREVFRGLLLLKDSIHDAYYRVGLFVMSMEQLALENDFKDWTRRSVRII